ncbi:major intrinsically disordered Notch2-binding receptor 1 [Denticeps clupeoides]|uniref:major intrinsically disordered Notch2-binding receptor 1 n=1 Tax=Denticeps clupeoides TaxID=299321 RepID=UPI0010A491D1|nr:major intrinsically disordered Notch2-binding receptor 1-like [Denticeps clupeoides]
MAERGDSPLVLLEMLDVLVSLQGRVSYADVCVCLSRRFPLPTLCELRSLLYSTACRDPCFPATLFRARLHPAASSSLSTAADVVSLFNLITLTRPPLYGPPYLYDGQPLPLMGGAVGPEGSDWPVAVPGTEGGARPQEGPYQLELGTSYTHAFPDMLTHTLQASPRDADGVHPGDADAGTSGLERVAAKRNVFKAEFHNLPPLVSLDANHQAELDEAAGGQRGRQDVLFLSLKNPYPDPAALRHKPPTPAEIPTIKHDSLDETRGSAYFSTPARDWPRPGSAQKSHSLEDAPRDRSEPVAAAPGPAESRPAGDGLLQPGLHVSGLGGSAPMALGDQGAAASSLEDVPGFEEVRAALKRLSARSLDFSSHEWPPGADGVASVSTQTDAASRLRSLNKLSIDNPDAVTEDDISAIFRFLDDISMCGSMAALVPEGGAEGGARPGSPDRRSRLGKLKRLFHSLEAPEDMSLGAGVGRLFFKIAEVEKRLEPLSDLTHTLTHILATLQRLEAETHTLSHAHALMEPPAARRKAMVARRDHTESSSTWSVSYSKEQHTHTMQKEQKEGHAVEQPLTPHLLHEAYRPHPLHSGSPNLSLRADPSWSQSELTPLELQAPDQLDFWTDDVYTPASDTLLRRTNTSCIQARGYRIAALCVTAAVIIVVIIVIPISTA